MSASRRGFSLIEVVIAVGVFSIAIVTMLALLPSLLRQAGDSIDLLAAQGLPDPIHLELQRLATGGFDELAAAIPVMASPLENGLVLVAARDCVRVRSQTYRPSVASGAISPGDQYFAAEVWRFDRSPLRYEPAGAVLPVFVRVSWPYRLPGLAVPTALAERSQFTFTLVLVR